MTFFLWAVGSKTCLHFELSVREIMIHSNPVLTAPLCVGGGGGGGGGRGDIAIQHKTVCKESPIHVVVLVYYYSLSSSAIECTSLWIRMASTISISDTASPTA